MTKPDKSARGTDFKSATIIIVDRNGWLEEDFLPEAG
jgi:hypothetical protein